MRSRNLMAAAVIAIGVSAVAEAQAPRAMPRAVRVTIDSVLDLVTAREYVAGLCIAIVRDGRVIYQRGAGWADRETGRRVDTNTLFYIASSTKSFTSLATVLLDRARVMDLDATLAQILPGAPFAQGVDPTRITVRQLLTHTHGIADGPIGYRAAYSGEIERASMIRALAAHGPARGGTAYDYTNLGYNILSLGIDSIAGKPWQDVIAERVLRPLGMTSTSARLSELPRDRLAMPYRAEPVGLARLPYAKQDDNMQAAGGIVSSTGDLARFVMAMMDGGVVDGRRVFPTDVVEEALRVQARFGSRFGEIDRFGYALGWNYGIVDGDTLVHHFGGFPGFGASVSFMPAHRTGIVMGANGGFAGPILDLVMQYSYALLNGNEPAIAKYREQLGMLEELAGRQRAAIAADRARRAARPQTTALPLTAYTGRYENDLFGSIEVTLRDGRIHVRNGVLESVAEVYDGEKNQLRVELSPGSGSVLEFATENGRVTAVITQGVRLARVR
jgi:CubicO group peptidase (beta-lactamase class C family)